MDVDLVDLQTQIERLCGRFCTVGLRFLAADRGRLWPGSGRLTDVFGQGLLGGAGPDGLLSPLAMLILLADDPALTENDLTDIGHVVLGIGRSTEPAVDVLGSVLIGSSSVLTSLPARRLAQRLARLPAAERVLGRLGSLPGARIASVAGGGLTALTVLTDINRLKRDGNPWDAWHRKGAGYIADWAGAGFDLASPACVEAPNPYTCGAAAVTGTVWLAAEAWQHREAIAHTTAAAYQAVVTEVQHVRTLASQALGSVGIMRDDLIDTIRNLDREPGLVRLPTVVTHGVADVVEAGGHVVGQAAHRGEKLLSSGVSWLGHLVP